MDIYFVRHGHPNYKNDCLTEIGHKQAAAVAERLKDSGIEKVFSSTKGRAHQTAEYTADLLGLEIVDCDFIRELGWKGIDDEPIPANGHPWDLARILASEGTSLSNKEWRNEYPFCRSIVVERCETVIQGIDAWLAELGYEREGDYYRVTKENQYKTVAMFSHAGSSSAAMSHMLNIPFPQFCGCFSIDFTSVTVIHLSSKVGELVSPKIELFNDAKHINGITVENIIGN